MLTSFPSMYRLAAMTTQREEPDVEEPTSDSTLEAESQSPDAKASGGPFLLSAVMMIMLTGGIGFMTVTAVDNYKHQVESQKAAVEAQDAVLNAEHAKMNAGYSSSTGKQAPVYVPPAAPAAQNDAPKAVVTQSAPPIDWNLPLSLLGFSVATFVTVKFAGPPAMSAIRSRRRKKDNKVAHAQTWNELFARKTELMTQWAKYETDVALMIDYPIMTDYTDPVVQRVITAMQKMRRAETLHIDVTEVSAEGSYMQSAVDEFEVAFLAAEQYAKRNGQSKMSPSERRKLSAARQALNIILDGESPAYEVDAAYKSLRGSLKGIIELPQQAIASLEQLTRKSLEEVPV